MLVHGFGLVSGGGMLTLSLIRRFCVWLSAYLPLRCPLTAARTVHFSITTYPCADAVFMCNNPLLERRSNAARVCRHALDHALYGRVAHDPV